MYIARDKLLEDCEIQVLFLLIKHGNNQYSVNTIINDYHYLIHIIFFINFVFNDIR